MMKVTRLLIKNFRGIQHAEVFFPDHVVLVGDNNVGKSTIFEALDLVLGPDRLNRRAAIDEHDFYLGAYCGSEGVIPPTIYAEATITRLNEEQRTRFKDYVEWWDEEADELVIDPPPGNVDPDHIVHALRVSFSGLYEEEEDDFLGETYFSKSEEEGHRQTFRGQDKQV